MRLLSPDLGKGCILNHLQLFTACIYYISTTKRFIRSFAFAYVLESNLASSPPLFSPPALYLFVGLRNILDTRSTRLSSLAPLAGHNRRKTTYPP